MASDQLSDAIDLSHHLSNLSLQLLPSPLHDLYKFFDKPGVINLAGGVPSPAYFPYSSIGAEGLHPETFSPVSTINRKPPVFSSSWVWKLFSMPSQTDKTFRINIPKYSTDKSKVNLSTALQYGRELPQLDALTANFTARVYKPAYKNYTTVVDVGNTDGWFKSVMSLCNPGEGVLTCEWAYPSALACMYPLGITPISVPVDGQGMRNDALRKILAGWDESARGKPRPHVMYTVPVAQNPCGSTMGAKRKQEIYDICVEYDIIIVEDDPCYFLQLGHYSLPEDRPVGKKNNNEPDDTDTFLASLVPSYLRFDYQGRVIRLDSFSKTIAPGSRMGWITCNPVFADKIHKLSGISSQNPSGFSQSLITSLLLSWGLEGHIRWLQGLQAQYAERRNFFIDCLEEEFDLRLSNGCEVYLASEKCKNSRSVQDIEKSGSGTITFFSFIPPTSGMFVWIKLNLDHHPFLQKIGYKALGTELWEALANAGVIFAPGHIFSANPTPDDEQSPHLRISFSNGEFQDMRKAAKIFAIVLKEFYDQGP